MAGEQGNRQGSGQAGGQVNGQRSEQAGDRVTTEQDVVAGIQARVLAMAELGRLSADDSYVVALAVDEAGVPFRTGGQVRDGAGGRARGEVVCKCEGPGRGKIAEFMARAPNDMAMLIWYLRGKEERIAQAEEGKAVLERELADVRAKFPVTFYEGLALPARVARLAEGWNKAVTAGGDLERELVREQAVSAGLLAKDRDSSAVTLAARARLEIAEARVERAEARVKELESREAGLLRCSHGHVHNQPAGERCPMCRVKELESANRTLYDLERYRASRVMKLEFDLAEAQADTERLDWLANGIRDAIDIARGTRGNNGKAQGQA